MRPIHVCPEVVVAKVHGAVIVKTSGLSGCNPPLFLFFLFFTYIFESLSIASFQSCMSNVAIVSLFFIMWVNYHRKSQCCIKNRSLSVL